MSPIIRAILICLLAMPVWAETAACLPGKADVQVIQNMAFGGLLVGSAGGRVVLTADGNLIPEGGGVGSGAQPPCQEARFRLTGPPRTRFVLQVEPLTPLLAGPSQGVRISDFRPSLSSFAGCLDATGQAELRLGARLDISANVLPGLYVAAQMKLILQIQDGSRLISAYAPFRISALLRAPLTLMCTESLDFGGLIPGGKAGRFEILPGGGFRTQGLDGPRPFKGAPHPAAFVLRGPVGTCYSIQLPRQIALTGAGAPMMVHGFTASMPLAGVLGCGEAHFGVGGALEVAPGQAPGVYTGTLVVTVCYP